MAHKCVHKGCEKTYTDPGEVCKYHPGPPVFHNGKQEWRCCQARASSFDEFLAIPPCTEGKHSTTDEVAKVEKKKVDAADVPSPVRPAFPAADKPPLQSARRASEAQPVPEASQAAAEATPPSTTTDAPAPDEAAVEIADGQVCTRMGCNAVYKKGQTGAEEETCQHHPGAPVFHEGSKGYSCCKRRVLEFDQFLKISGCSAAPQHLFVASRR